MENESNEMKTYVVEDAFCDYTCGMIVVKAKSKEEAINLIINNKYLQLNANNEADLINIKIIKKNIRELKDDEVVVYVKGGG